MNRRTARTSGTGDTTPAAPKAGKNTGSAKSTRGGRATKSRVERERKRASKASAADEERWTRPKHGPRLFTHRDYDDALDAFEYQVLQENIVNIIESDFLARTGRVIPRHTDIIGECRKVEPQSARSLPRLPKPTTE